MGRDELEKELEEKLGQLVSLSDQTIEQRGPILTQATKDLIDSYSNQIRNIGLISGVVAPLSLSLLQVQNVSTNIYILLSGFVFLLGNIAFSQILLNKELSRKDRLLVNSIFNFSFAASNKRTAEDKNVASSERVSKFFDFQKNINEFDKLLGISQYSTEPLITHANLRKYNRWTLSIFSVGCGLIALSVIWHPFINGTCSILEWVVLLWKH